MKKHLLTIALLLCSCIVLQAQTKLIEKVSRKADEIIIPYEKYQLPNGLTLVIHEDHSDPMVHVDVTYHVGSARETPGKSGFAHFFEHMMFQGSEHVADEEHFKVVSEAGGTLNGSTTSDRTNYFETLPVNQLEKALWLEADRMGFLLDAVTQKKFENQRSTVKNERGQNYDNKPYGLIHEKVASAMYPTSHPYAWPTIGYLEDLDRADVNDLKRFFMHWYGPNNAVLTVAGDVQTQEVIKLVEKYFGPIKRGPEVRMPEVPKSVVLNEDRYISYEDNIRFPMLRITYPTVPNRHPDEAPLDILSDILGGGKNSILYKTLIKSQKAINANVSHPAQELSGLFTVTILPFPGVSMGEMEKMTHEAFEEFEKKGATDDDLLRYKASYEAQLINSLSSISGKASMLASYQTFTGNPGYISEEMKRYQSVTKADIMRVYNTYIKGKHAVILSVYPKGKSEMVASKDNYTTPSRLIVQEDEKTNAYTYQKAVDTFDRNKKPESGANPVIHVPDFWQENFPNGLKIIGSKNTEVPSVTLQISIEAGHRIELNLPGKAGISKLTADLMNESSIKYSSEQMNDLLEKLGSSISVSSDQQFITLTISTLVKNLDATLALAEERIFHPLFSEEDFNRLKKQQLEGIANQSTQAVVIANKAFNRILYGEGNIMSVPAMGTESSVGSITLEDVKSFYATYFSPSISTLVVVGDADKNQIVSKLGFLRSWKGKTVKITESQSYPEIDKTRIYLVDKEGAPQSEIRVGYIALPYDVTGEFYTANLMNFNLGGAFNSRINLNLREDKGWTYGAHSYFSGDRWAGPFLVSTGVRGNATDSSVVQIMKELQDYQSKGITDEELSFTKKSIGQSDALKYETPVQKASFLKRIVMYNLDKNFVDKQNDILEKMTRAEINAIAKSKLPTDKMVIVVVGDKKSIQQKLAGLPYEVVELDKEGKPIQ